MEAESLSWQSIFLRFGVVCFLILLNGFFVAAEFALVGARRTRLKQKAMEGNRLAKLADRLVENLDEAIAATQLGITIASLLVGWIGEATLAEVFLQFFHFLPGAWAAVASHSVAVAAAFALITLMHVVLGELIPKGIAIRYPNNTALAVSQPMRFAMLLFKPFVWVLNGTGNLGLRLIGMPPAGHQTVHSVEELKLLIEASHKGGALDDLEKDLLHKIFKFGNLVARQVMVPRTDMSCIQAESTLSELISISARTGHTRFPVFEGDLDNIIGILHMKDLIRNPAGQEKPDLRYLMKDPHFVPEAMPIVQLLTFLKQKHTQMVIVVDEFGGTSGLATLEDVIEEIIGDFYDEHHPVIRDIIYVAENEILLQARVRLDEINERFHLKLQSEGADTLGGYVLQAVGAIPKVGEEVEVPGAVIRVEDMSNWKINTLRLFLQPQPVEPE